MQLDPRTAPSRDLVKAYMLAQSNEAGRMMMADLELAVEAVSRDKTDKEGRIDPYKLAMADAVREFLRRMKRIAAMAGDPEWQKIDAARQVAEAAGKL
jgi:hypothetical protein